MKSKELKDAHQKKKSRLESPHASLISFFFSCSWFTHRFPMLTATSTLFLFFVFSLPSSLLAFSLINGWRRHETKKANAQKGEHKSVFTSSSCFFFCRFTSSHDLSCCSHTLSCFHAHVLPHSEVSFCVCVCTELRRACLTVCRLIYCRAASCWHAIHHVQRRTSLAGVTTKRC